ncbi:MAG TPA: hypothetical protein VGF06_00860 [Terriglobales bacterium]|jgi:hypothetical protein
MKNTIRLMLAVLLLAATAAPMFAEGGGLPPLPTKPGGGHLTAANK